MKIQVAVLCDSATTYDNRLCILGTFDTIRAQSFPVTKPYCAIAIQILWAKSEEGQHDIVVQFMNEDGVKTLEDVSSTASVLMPKGTYFIATNHIVSLQQLVFQKAGTYQITALVDGEPKAEMQLQVALDE